MEIRKNNFLGSDSLFVSIGDLRQAREADDEAARRSFPATQGGGVRRQRPAPPQLVLHRQAELLQVPARHRQLHARLQPVRGPDDPSAEDGGPGVADRPHRYAVDQQRPARAATRRDHPGERVRQLRGGDDPPGQPSLLVPSQGVHRQVLPTVDEPDHHDGHPEAADRPGRTELHHDLR